MKKAREIEAFARRLAAERQRLQQTQAEIAVIGGVTPPTQIAYEQGLRSPTVDYLRRLRSAGVDAWYVLCGEPLSDLAAEATDWNLVGKIAAAMHEWATSREVDIPADKFGELLRLLYNEYRRKPHVDSLDVDRIMRLVA